MSHLSLVKLLNCLARTQKALISEGAMSLVASNLSAETTLEVARAATEGGWLFSISDSHGTEHGIEEVDADFEPFRVALEKPLSSEQVASGDLFIATEVGYTGFLRKGHGASHWRILGLTSAFSTRARIYCGWTESLPLIASPPTKPPRLLVKESANVRTVPEDIRHWLLAEGCALESSDPFQVIWAAYALNYLTRCLANEIDSTGTLLMFKGPPKLNLTISQFSGGGEVPSLASFETVQEAAGWVFDSAREAEVKHILLSAEIARSGRADGLAGDYLSEYLRGALDCAKIAYQMAVSEITKDTLKSLGELRKAVTEETSKATDATRQAVAAIATALTVGLGLIAARLTVQINPYLITLVMCVALAYTLISVASGRKFITIQQRVRQEWQPKLYRFLSGEEYKKMVTEPISEAEKLFNRVSCWGLLMLGMTALGIIIFVFVYELPATPQSSAPFSSPHVLDPRKPTPGVRPPIPPKLDKGMKADLKIKRLTI